MKRKDWINLMKKKWPLCFIGSLFVFNAFAQEEESFDPWYTGPLLTSSANCLRPGVVNIQPYLYITDTYAKYSNHGHSSSVSNTITLNQTNFVQFGLNNYLDVTFSFNEIYNHKKNVNIVEYGDVGVSFGIQLLRQKKYTPTPSIRLILAEIFPSGRYKQLNPNKLGLDAAGEGSYQTKFGLNFSKIVYWIKKHPTNFRLAFSYYWPSLAKVREFHTFGGGYNTYGKIRPPQKISAAGSFEFSLTQRWVYAMDFSYVYQTKSTFCGTPGTNSNGSIAQNTQTRFYVFSLAPAIEYNFNDHLGIVTGFWFPVLGENTSNFLSYLFSVTYTF